jgi:hypothetical protein
MNASMSLKRWQVAAGGVIAAVALTVGSVLAAADGGGWSLAGGQSHPVVCTGDRLSFDRADRRTGTVNCSALPTTTLPATTTTVPPTTTTVAPTTTTTAPPPVGAILFAAVDQLGSPQPVTLASALATAKAVNLISAQPKHAKAFGPYLAQMRAANPALRLIVYTDGSHDIDGTLPEGYYAHTGPIGTKANRIVNPAFNTFEMDMTPGRGWATYLLSLANQHLAGLGWDGTFLDSMGGGACALSPVHPGTTTVWTYAECLAATNTDARAVLRATGGILIANGLANGSTFVNKQTPASQLIAGITGGDAEEFPQGRNWVDNLTMLQTPGAVIMTNTKFNPADQWHRFTLATFTLGTNGISVYDFIGTPGSNPDAPDIYQPAAARLGGATGVYYTVGAGYERNFTGGFAVANPSTGPVTFTFARPVVNLSGQTVTSETLAAQSGDLLVG